MADSPDSASSADKITPVTSTSPEIQGKACILQNIDSDQDLSVESYGPSGFAGLVASRYVAICASFSAIGGLLFGYDQGVISVILTMDHFLQRFPEVDGSNPGSGFYKGLMTAMITLGAAFGALNQGWLADVLSRKYTILLAVVVFTIGSTLQVAAVDYAMLVIARLIGGLGIGLLSAVVPTYISEISPAEIRGTLLVFEQLSIVVGIIVAFWITYGTRFIHSAWSWRLPFLIQIMPGLILGIGAIFLPFSPRWLANKGRDDQALHTLARLRQLPRTDSRVEKEWLDILAESRYQQLQFFEAHPTLESSDQIKRELASWTDCFQGRSWRRTVVGSGITTFQQFVGINALVYYSPTLFAKMGLHYDMQLIMSGVLNIMQLVGILTSVWTMDAIGRRKLLLMGAVGMFACHVITAVLCGKFASNWAAHKTESWVSVAFMLVFMVTYGASWGPVGWAVPAEVFPSSLRAKGVAFAVFLNWVSNFVIGLITPVLSDASTYAAYTFFAVFCLGAFVFTFFCVPETSGRSLEEMDAVFGDHTAIEDGHRKKLVLEQIRQEKKVGSGAVAKAIGKASRFVEAEEDVSSVGV